MNGTQTSDSSVTCQSISSAMVSIPISIRTPSKIGGNAITIAPSADAWLLISPISIPVWRSSW